MTNSGADFDLHWPPGPANRVKSLLSNYNWIGICIYSRRLFIGALIVIEFVFVFVVGAYLQVPNQASGIQRQLIKAKGGRVTIALSSTYFDEDDDGNDVEEADTDDADDDNEDNDNDDDSGGGGLIERTRDRPSTPEKK